MTQYPIKLTEGKDENSKGLRIILKQHKAVYLPDLETFPACSDGDTTTTYYLADLNNDAGLQVVEEVIKEGLTVKIDKLIHIHEIKPL